MLRIKLTVFVYEKVMVMEGNCVACGAEAETKMFATAIPHFKEVSQIKDC